jgi:hypothetical protein
MSVLLNETLVTATGTNVAASGAPSEQEKIVAEHPGGSNDPGTKSKPVVVTEATERLTKKES